MNHIKLSIRLDLNEYPHFQDYSMVNITKNGNKTGLCVFRFDNSFDDCSNYIRNFFTKEEFEYIKSQIPKLMNKARKLLNFQ